MRRHALSILVALLTFLIGSYLSAALGGWTERPKKVTRYVIYEYQRNVY